MIALVPIVISGSLLVVSQFLNLEDARAARTRAVAVGWCGLAISLGLLIFKFSSPFDLRGVELCWVGPSWYASTPTVLALVTVLIVSMAPVRSHPPRTLAAILRLMACAHGFAATDNLIVLLVLWVASAAIAYGELVHWAGTTNLGATSFRRYHSLSAGAAAVGVAAHAAGARTTGFVAWVVAIATREATLPLHGWFPAMAARAPLGLVVAFVAPQSGVVVHLSISHGIAGSNLAHVLATLGAATAVLGAMLGLAQKNARSASAWLLISQTGLISFGLENSSIEGVAGALLSWQAMALGSTGFVMTLAALDARRGTLDLAQTSGSFSRTPRMATAFLLLGFGSVGLPLTLGFIAEDLLMQGSIDEFPAFGAILVVTTAINGINVLRCFFALFSGTARHSGELDLMPRESAAVTVAIIVLLLGGVVPGYLVGLATPQG